MLQLIHAGKRFGSVWAPVRFSLTVKPGELVWLSGPSGVGKSVIVRLALGLMLSTTGSVETNGVNLGKSSRLARQRLRRRISAVLDDESAHSCRVREWVAYGLWCAGRSWAKSLSDARERLEDFGLVELVGRPHDELTRGQRFAVSLARGLMRKPELLLIDWAGAFATPLPHALMEAFEGYMKDSGACLAIGEPSEQTAHLNGRRERLELDRTARES